MRHPIFTIDIYDEKTGQTIEEIKIFLDGKVEGLTLPNGHKYRIGNRIGCFSAWCMPLRNHFLEKDSTMLEPNSSSPNKKFIACDGFSQPEQPCFIKNSR